MRSGACHPEPHVDESMVEIPVGLATLKNPDTASRFGCINSCVAAVLSV